MYIPKREVVYAMTTEIHFKVKGEERKKLAYAIGELLGMSVKYTRTPKFDYLIGSCILDKNGVFHTSEDLSESELELVLERFYKGEPIQQSELPEDETVEADVLSISVPRNMFTDDKLENLQKLIEGKQMLFKRAFRAEQLEVVITQNQVSLPWFPLASEPDAVNAYTEFIFKLCELAIKLKRVSLKDKEVENEKMHFDVSFCTWVSSEMIAKQLVGFFFKILLEIQRFVVNNIIRFFGTGCRKDAMCYFVARS